MPGQQLFLLLDTDQVPDNRRDAAQITNKKDDSGGAGNRKQQKHECVRQNDTARAGVHRKQRVTQPCGHQALDVVQVRQLSKQDRRPLRDRKKVAAECQHDGDTREHLDSLAVKALPEELGQCVRAAAPQVPPEEKCTKHIANCCALWEEDVRARLRVIGEAGFAEKHRGTHDACHKRTDDQQCRCPAPRYVVVVEIPDAATSVVTDRDIDEDADRDRGRIDIHQPGERADRARVPYTSTSTRLVSMVTTRSGLYKRN